MKKYVFILITILAFYCVPQFNPLPKGKDFVIVQSMEYRNKVDLTSFGVAGNQIIYSNSLLSPTNIDEIQRLRSKLLPKHSSQESYPQSLTLDDGAFVQKTRYSAKRTCKS